MMINNSPSRVRRILYISQFSALTAISAFLKIPVPYVPFTLQTFFVILSGNLLGSRAGAISQIIYLAIGLAGLPIFSNGGGIGYILQPTFGYLAAYPLGAVIAGLVRKIKPSKSRENKSAIFIRIILLNFLSILVIFIFGVIYLYYNLNYVAHSSITFGKALWIGFFVFIPMDILKILLASFITMRLSRIIH
jgi:biotin transport system substrate-specific component